MTISSPHNAKLKEIRALQRPRERAERGRFVAEGEDLVGAAAAAGWAAVYRLVTPDAGLEGEVVEPALLGEVSALGSGSRALGVYETRWSPVVPGRCLALFGVGDPGNVGSAIRSARAFGADAVLLGPRCADPFGPKAVRASMGAIFAVPVARVGGISELPGTVVGLAGEAKTELRAETLTEPITLVVGAERDGLSPEDQQACDVVCRISIESDSLNAAMAATVALYELTRRT